MNQRLYGGRPRPEQARTVEGFKVLRYCYKTGMEPDQGVI